jgi:hypothetical protein
VEYPVPEPQTYKTHRHNPALSTAASVFSLLALVLIITALVRGASLAGAAVLSLTIAVMFLVAISRIYTVRLQDRIIRLEMRLRLAGLLPHRATDIQRLSVRQLIALRFASDAELPALVDRSVTENLTPDQIKQAIRDWQPDYHRT